MQSLPNVSIRSILKTPNFEGSGYGQALLAEAGRVYGLLHELSVEVRARLRR
jgi:hypothetical protein